MADIPITVLIATKNEATRLPRCLKALKVFSDIVVIDSASTDGTALVAVSKGVRVVSFVWDGGYPKKRQWVLDTLDLRYDRILFIDADEEATPALVDEISALDWSCAGYFITGHYVWRGKTLCHGAPNRKLVLFDRRKMMFPVIDDLDIPGMGEMEGHYQPVLKQGFEGEKIGHLKSPMLHHAGEDVQQWQDRHRRYAAWESGMNRKNAWPDDPSLIRQALKRLFRALPFRGAIYFFYAFIFRAGFLDGAAGLQIARLKAAYYAQIT